MIKFYKNTDPFGFCSNFYPCKFYLYSKWWTNVEAAYQAKKCVNQEDFELIWNAKSPREARNLGQKVKLIDGWDTIKYCIMLECVLAKFLQNPNLAAELLTSGDEELVEDSTVDYYWGCGKDGSGLNMLGKVLTEVRSILKEK